MCGGEILTKCYTQKIAIIYPAMLCNKCLKPVLAVQKSVLAELSLWFTTEKQEGVHANLGANTNKTWNLMLASWEPTADWPNKVVSQLNQSELVVNNDFLYSLRWNIFKALS